MLSPPVEITGALVALVFLTCGIYMAWRVLIWCVRYDDHAIHVVGLLWSRRIPRSRVVAVAPDISQPAVIWRSPGGRLVSTPLNVVVMGNSPLLPLQARRRRIAFMAMLEMWTEGRSLEEAKQELAARARSRSAPPERGTRREWRVRHKLVPRRSDRLGEAAEWVSPFVSAFLIFVAIGVGRRGPVIPLPTSAVLAAVAASVLAALALLIVARRSIRRARGTVRQRVPMLAPASALTGAGILAFRAEQSVRWYPEASWGIAVCVVAAVAAVASALILRTRQ